jgi:hypothetical protein
MPELSTLNKPAVECFEDIFAEPKDFTLCTCTDAREAGAEHIHCAIDGIRHAKDGGGDYGNTVRCKGDCGDFICFSEDLACGTYVNGNGPFCNDCRDKREAELFRDGAMYEHAWEAVKSLRSCRAMLRSETNAGKVRELVKTVQEAQDELVGLEREMLAFLIPADAVTLRESGPNTIHELRASISETDGSHEILYANCGERFHNGRATIGGSAKINCGRCLRIHGSKTVAA